MWWLDPGKEVLNVLFNRILAPYVENLDLNQVNYGIGQGQLILKNLRLKKGALDKFRLPIDVLEGHLGKFSLSLHWLNLGNQPVEILVEDVYLLVVPSSHSKQDPQEEEERAQAIKRERLDNAELLHLRGEAEKSGDQQPQGFWESLLAKVINNLQISVKNIHIRYEDKYSVPNHPFVAGVTLDGFTAISVNDNWEPAFIESAAGAIHKLAKLESLAIYFDTDVKNLESDKKNSIFHANATKEDQDTAAPAATHQYILNPVSGEGRITINRKADPRTPRLDVQLFLDTIGVAVDDSQYRDTILLLDAYHVYMRKHQYRNYWPQDEANSLARSRLLFAGNAVLGSVRERRKQWTWPYFAERRDDRNRYIDLFERKVVGNLSPSDTRDIEKLEKKLSYEDIRFYRSIARSRLRKDEVLRKRLQAEQAPPQPAKQTWTSWIWGSTDTEQKPDENAFNQPMTESQKKELYDVIDFDERNALAESFEAPRDAVKALFSLKLNQGIFALRTSPHSNPQELTSMSFQEFHASFLQRTDNFEASISLGDFAIRDGIMENTIHKKIVSVKNKELAPESGESIEQDDEPFFYANFEKNPLDDRADSALTVKMRSVQVVYHRGYVEAIYKFFQAPASHLESVEALLSAASQTFEGFRKETRAGLEHALQTHKTIDVRMDLNAPVIIIPEDVTSSKCKHLIIDAGHISVESDLAKKDALREIQMKRKKAYSEKDYKHLESLMYDRFSLKLGAAQFVLGNDFDACLNALLPDSKDNLHLLERINIDLQVHNSIVPSVPDLPRIKVAGKLPLLQVNFSDIKYKALMRLIDVSIPNFGGDEPEKRPAIAPTDHKSFQLSTGFFSNTGPEYNVEDHDESKDTANDDDQETFFEAEDGGDEVPEGRQHKFDLSFQVDELRASVSRSTSNEEERPLGDVTLRRFSLEFALTELDMTVDVDLRSLSLDLVQPGSKPLRFISSVEDEGNSTEDLMIVHYSRVQRTAPEFISKYEGFDQTVEVKLSTFIFTALPEPIISMYDFIMTTFVPSNGPPPITEGTSQPSHPHDSQLESQQPEESKIRVLVELASVQLRLISGDEALATLCLSTANVSVILSKTLRVVGRLGNLALSNDMRSHPVLPEFNNILSIEGEELAEFRYQTFDPESEDYNGINSSVFLHTASLKLHFLAEPIHEILVFLSKLAKLKGLYDAATQAAVQSASNVDVGGMQFDLSIKTPILVYPRDPTESKDTLVMQLGEVNVKNALQENENKTSGTLNGILLVSTTYNGSQPSSLKIIENIDINADIIQNMSSSRHTKDVPRSPDMQVSVNISDVKLHLTQIQYTILLALASSVSSVMASTQTEAIQYNPSQSDLTPIPLQSETTQPAHTDTDTTPASTSSSLDLIVSINAISLHLYDKHATARESLKEHGIAKFALIDNSLRLKTLRDGSTEVQLILRSFTVANTRPGSTRFREIVPSAQHDRNQFMVLYTIPNSSDVPPVAVVTIDAPQIIFAIDPLMALIDFFSTKEAPNSPENTQQLQTTHGNGAGEPKAEPNQHLNFRLELHELSVSVLENDSNPETHCVKLFVHHLLVSQQAVTTLSIERMGMSLVRLGKLPESVRFLDDVDLTLSLNSTTSATQQFSSIEATVKPVIFRASYGDIMLITSIVQRAIESYGQLGTVDMDSSTNTAESILPPEHDKDAQTKQTNTSGNARVSLSKEQLTASFDGLRLILIGDLYEQPVLHLKFNPFILGAKDWSGELHATTTMAMQINYWNLLNSHWEPLIDPWTFTLTAKKDGASGGTNFGLSARDRLDLNVSTTLVEFANTASSIWAKEGSQVLQKPRGTYAPYRLRNRTGSTIVVWADDDQSGTKDINTVKIGDNQAVDWRFDGWKTTREHVSSGGQHSLCLQFIDKDWERLRGIPVDKEGEFVFSMRPRSKYPNRLLVEVKVIDAVKIVTIRSTYQVENHTLYPLELMLVNESGHPIHSMERIVPGESFPLPIDVASSSRIRVQPDQGFGYKWCQAIRWEDLIARKSFTIKCPHTQPDEAPFRFQAFVQTDARELTSRAFPKISLKLRAPLELENLLPYNLEYRIYDKDTDQNWRSYLRKGGVMPVHSVELSHFVLLNVFLQDTVFNASEFAIINTDGHSDFDIESRITLRDQRNRKLDLRLNYVRYPDSGGAFRVQIYSPVIFVNKTGLPFFIKTTRSTRAGSQDVAGDDRFDSLAEPSPYLASHPYDNGHEYILKVGHSAWSKTISLEAPTAESALVIPSEKFKSEEIHVGVSWLEGRGKYKLTKIVTLTPRFLLKNNLPEPISYREHGYAPRDKSTLQPGERIPLQFIRAGDEKLLTIAYPGLNSQWSAPTNIEDIGSVHLRLRSPREGASGIPLVRSDIHVDTSTIFVTFSQASEWPFLIENQSDYFVTLSQTGSGQNPDQVKRSNPTYSIPQGTNLEYAWDFPAARDKKVLLIINGAPRVVDIMEIGNLMPFKFHDKKSSKAVSLDVRAAGQQQILRISNYHPDRSVYRPRNRNTQSISRQDTISSTVDFEPIAETVSPTLSLSLNMAGIGISLMNRKMVEVLYASIDALKLEYTSSPVAQSFNISCGTLQLDNQLHDALYPVLLQPTPINKESTGVAALPTIQGSVIWLNDREHGVLFVKYCSILLQALTIECDEDLLFALIDLTKVQGLSWEESDDSLMLEDIKVIPEPSHDSGGEELYFEVLELQPIKLLLSFMRTERVSTEAKSGIRNPIAVALNAFTMAVGNINDAPLEMNALGLKDMHLTMPELTARISYHYRQEVLRQLYRLLGSADFIGNPVGLFTNVSSGVADIFYEPFHGNVMHGNKELGLGIAKGAASFVKKTVFGVSDSVTKFTGSVGKGLSAATFDPEYQARRRIAQRRNKPRHAIYGVAAGGEAFASSVTSAVEGVLMKPIEGAEQEGAVGFFKGIGKGIVGAVTKPVVGVFDLASNVSEGIRNTTTVFDSPERDRVRLPRYVSADGVLKPYNAREALGQYWMRDLNNGAYRQEAYVAHINSAGDEKVVLLTRQRVLSFWVKNLRLEWDLPFSDVHGITVEDTGIRFGHKAGKDQDRFAFIPDKSSQSWFFGQLSTVVKAFNARKRMDV